MSKTRMFVWDGKRMRTWNPIIGCYHDCVYCWARKLALTKLRNTEKYRDGFNYRFVERELTVRFKSNEMVFVSDMGDMFGDWVPASSITSVIEYTYNYPETTFLFLTKNPKRYIEFIRLFRDNHVLGATIETDDDNLYYRYRVSRAVSPQKRFLSMITVRKKRPDLRIMVSVEPIMDFTSDFYKLLVMLEPSFIYIGYDNYNNHLPEPPVEKTLELIDKLREHGIRVIPKTIPEKKVVI